MYDPFEIMAKLGQKIAAIEIERKQRAPKTNPKPRLNSIANEEILHEDDVKVTTYRAAGETSNKGTDGVSFKAFTEVDPSIFQTPYYQTITFQPPYQKKSLEELRVEDYSEGRRGVGLESSGRVSSDNQFFASSDGKLDAGYTQALPDQTRNSQQGEGSLVEQVSEAKARVNQTNEKLKRTKMFCKERTSRIAELEEEMEMVNKKNAELEESRKVSRRSYLQLRGEKTIAQQMNAEYERRIAELEKRAETLRAANVMLGQKNVALLKEKVVLENLAEEYLADVEASKLRQARVSMARGERVRSIEAKLAQVQRRNTPKGL